MRFILIAAAVSLLACASGSAMAQGVYHDGFTRQNGTYVQPHYQSAPDHGYNNNWSTSPNVNPYTGQQGARAPTFNDRPPAYPSSVQPVPRYGQFNR
jgi:hypothetical protein